MIVKLDALYEGVLGVALVLAAATGALDGSDFPSPVGTAILLIVGWVLLALCGLIWSGRLALRWLAAGNALAAAAGLVWLLAAEGWSSAGAGLTSTTVVVL